MKKFLAKRLIQTIIVLILVSFFTFLLMYMLPGDPVAAIAGDGATQQQYDTIYKYMEMDKPFLYRYVKWIWNVLHGDFGMSYKYNSPVTEIVFSRIPLTMYMVLLALILTAILGIIFGIISAVKRGKWIDNVITVIANISSCLPVFWVGIVLMLIFSVKLQLLPTTGFTWPWENFKESILQTIMPVVCLSLTSIATMTRQVRSSMLDVIHQDYIRTARAKGVKESGVICKHALKNSMVTIITMLGVRIGGIIGNTAFVESVFNIPGLGQLTILAVNSKDFFVMQACALIFAIIFCLTNLIVDILYSVIDPRIRLQ